MFKLVERRARVGDPIETLPYPRGLGVIQQARAKGDRAQARHGVVGAEMQAVLGARGEHAVRLTHPLEDQVVDHHANVAFGAIEDDGRECASGRRGVCTCGDTLRRSLFITRRAVNLTGKEQSAKILMLKRCREPAWVAVAILDRIAGFDDLGALKALDRAQERQLRLPRERRRNAVGIDDSVVETLGFEEDLMPVAIAETNNLVLDRRTVTRPPTRDRTTKQGRVVEAIADHVVRP